MLLLQIRETDLQRDALVSDTLANHPGIVQANEDVDSEKVDPCRYARLLRES